MPFFLVNDCRLFFTVQGQGTPILFIHPPVLTHFNFEYQIKELSKKFQVITFDIRGHGRSSYSKQPVTYPLIAEDMKKLLDHLKIQKTYICGYSIGGSVALEFLLSNPDRALGGIVISGMSEVNDWYLKNKIVLAMSLAKVKALSVLAVITSWSNSKTRSSFWRMLKEQHMGAVQNMEQYYRYSLTYNCTNKLEKIKNPVLLVYGQKDQLFQNYAKLMHHKLPQSELKGIQQVKHQIPTKAAFEINDLIKQFIFTHEEKGVSKNPY